jgi:hypothetical protein
MRPALKIAGFLAGLIGATLVGYGVLTWWTGFFFALSFCVSVAFMAVPEKGDTEKGGERD